MRFEFPTDCRAVSSRSAPQADSGRRRMPIRTIRITIRTMPVRLPLLALLLATLAACATAGTGTTSGTTDAGRPTSGPLSDAELDAFAALLRLEDRREYAAAALDSAAASPSARVRGRAALAAGRIGDRRAVPLLTRLLADADTAVAASAAFSLGELADTTAVPALVPYVSADRITTAPTVVGEAALALGKMPTAAGKQAVEGFLRAAPASGPGVQRAVGQALLAVWRFPRPADVAPIAPWLGNADPELRWRAAYALSRRATPEGTAALFARADDPDPLVRSFAARALTRALADSSSVTAPRALQRLVAATADTSHAVSVSAIRSLGTHPDPASLRRLEELLDSGDAYLAIAAAESLGRLDSLAVSTAPALRRVAMDAAKPVFLRTTALDALVAVSPEAAADVARAFAAESGWRYRAAAARAAARLDDPGQVLAFLSDPDARVAAAAVEGATAGEAAGDTLDGVRGLLAGALQHPDVIVRANALGAIARRADPGFARFALDAFQRAQGDTLNDAALAALDVLGAVRAKDPQVAPAFFRAFARSGDYLVRQRVRQAFGDTLAAPWGEPLPVETPWEPSDYRGIVRDYVAPPLAGRPRPRALIVTDRGEIEVELFAEDAPLTVLNFLTLAGKGYFDGQEWPRVVANFVIQGGDPRGDTSGGPGYAIRDEMNRHPYLTGTLGMALSGPDTGGSQWFITHSPQPHLDGGYTVFGRVTRGMDVANRVLPGDRIVRITEVR